MTDLNIFLISSKELEPERKTIVAFANSLNTALEKQDMHVTIVERENLKASTEDNSEEHNNELSKCDICIALFWTKINKRIKKQFDLAVKLLNRNKSKKVYAYFKEGNEATTALKEFRDSLFAKHRLLYTSFGNPDTLKAHFLLQVIEYIKFHHDRRFEHNNVIEIENGKVAAGGREYVDLTNVPFAGNNERYKYLQQNIRDKQELMTYIPSDHADYEKHATELQEMKGKLSKMGTDLWDTALVLTELSGSEHRPRFRRAMELFFNGDDKGAQAVLNEEEIEEEKRKKVQASIEEYRLKIKELENDDASDNSRQIVSLYKKAVMAARNNAAEDEYTDLLWDFIAYLNEQDFNANGTDIHYEECLDWIKDITYNESEENKYGYYCLYLLADFHRVKGDLAKAECEYKESLDIQRKLLTEGGIDMQSFALCIEDYAILKSQRNSHDEALNLIKEALALKYEQYKKKVSPDSTINYARCLSVYGYILLHAEKNDEAIQTFENSIGIYKQLIEKSPDDFDLYAMLAMDIGNLSTIYKSMYQYEVAKEKHQEALGIFEFLYEKQPSLPYGHDYATSLLNLGCLYYQMKLPKESIPYITKALELFIQLENINPEAYKDDIAHCLMNRGLSYSVLAKYDNSENDFSGAIAIYRQLTQKQEDVYAERMAACLCRHCQLLREKQEYDQAIIECSEAVEIYRNLANAYPETYQIQLANALSSLGSMRVQMNDGEIAERELNEAIQIIMNHKYKDLCEIDLASCFIYLGRNYYYCLDKADDAIEALHKSLDIYNSKNNIDGADYNNEIAMIYGDLGNAYLWKKDSPTAIRMYNKGISTFENMPNKTIANNSKLALLLNNLAWLYYKNGEIEKAEPLARRAVEIEGERCLSLGFDSKDMLNYKDTLDRILEEKDKANETKEAKTEPAAADISAEITYIKRKTLKSGKDKKKIGIVFTINGEKIPVFFDSKVQTMIYVCTLLCKKLDTKMYKKEFSREESHSLPWLREVYKKIDLSKSRDFDDWFDAVENNDGRPLNQAKSQTVNKIKKALAGQADGINYCIVETKKDKYGNSYYDLKIHPDKIIVSQELHSLIDDRWPYFMKL